MPGFDQLGDIPEERLKALLRKVRAIRAREGLAAPGDPEAGPAGAAPSQAAQPPPAGTRHGPRHRRKTRLRYGLAMILGVVALAGGSAVLAIRPAGHAVPRHIAAPRPPSASAPSGPATASAGEPTPGPASPTAPAPPKASAPSTAPAPPKASATSTAPAPPAPVAGQATSPAAGGTEVAGIGCPDGLGLGVILDAAAIGPEWHLADGGWTGNGCDGMSAWTVDAPGPPVNPATLTWDFQPPAGTSQCALAVYVPTKHALGEADYAISSSSGALATMVVNQATGAGEWIALGTYPVAGSVSIQFVPQGGAVTTAGDDTATFPGPLVTIPGLASQVTLSGLIVPAAATGPGKGDPGKGNGPSVAASAAQATCF